MAINLILSYLILGPLLFFLYVNDLRNTSKLLSFHFFADDTNIYCSSENLNDLELANPKSRAQYSG